jgi:hypothetical protein
MNDYYQTCGTPKPEPRKRTKARQARIQGDEDAGVIHIAGNADDEIIVTGDVDRLRFRL